MSEDHVQVPPIVITTIYGEKICLACEMQWEPCEAHKPEPLSMAMPLRPPLSMQLIPATFKAPAPDDRTWLERTADACRIAAARYGSPVAAWRSWYSSNVGAERRKDGES
jgi:hypothetical protein